MDKFKEKNNIPKDKLNPLVMSSFVLNHAETNQIQQFSSTARVTNASHQKKKKKNVKMCVKSDRTFGM